MGRTTLANTLLRLSIGGLAISVFAQMASWVRLPSNWLLVALGLMFAVIAAVIGLLQLRVEILQREWPFFTYASLRTLFRRFPPWLGALAVLFIGWQIAGPVLLGLPPQDYALFAAMYAVQIGALQSLIRQPWLLQQLTCPNGHAIRYFNRFCPTCSALLPKIAGSD